MTMNYEVRRKGTPLAEDWRWFRLQHSKELKERGIGDANPFDAQGRIDPKVRKAIVDILTPKAVTPTTITEPTEPTTPTISDTLATPTIPITPTGRPPITPETVPDAPSYFDPEVWKERVQRMADAAYELSPIAGIPQRVKTLMDVRKDITDDERRRIEGVPDLEKVWRYGAAGYKPLGILQEESERVFDPLKGAATKYREAEEIASGAFPGLTTRSIAKDVIGHIPSALVDEKAYSQRFIQQLLGPELYQPEVKQRYDILKARGVGEVSALATAYKQAEAAGEVGFIKSIVLSILNPIDLAIGTKGLGGPVSKTVRSTRRVEDVISKLSSEEIVKDPKIKDSLMKTLEDLRRKKIIYPQQREEAKKFIQKHTRVSDEEIDLASSAPMLSSEIADVAVKNVGESVAKLPDEARLFTTEQYLELLSNMKNKKQLTKSMQNANVKRISKQTGLSEDEVRANVKDITNNFMTPEKVNQLSNIRLTPNIFTRISDFFPLPKKVMTGLRVTFTPFTMSKATGNEVIDVYAKNKVAEEALMSQRYYKRVQRQVLVDRAGFDISDDARMLLLDGSRKAWGDVAQQSSDYLKRGLIPKIQHDAFRAMQLELNMKAVEVESITGEPIRILSNRYFPRLTIEKDKVTNQYKVVGVRSGEPAFFQQKRQAEFMEDQLKLGTDYSTDINGIVDAYIAGGDRILLDHLFREDLLNTDMVIKHEKGIKRLFRRVFALGDLDKDPTIETVKIAELVDPKAPKIQFGKQVFDEDSERFADIRITNPHAVNELASLLGKRSDLKLITVPEMASQITKTTTAGSADFGQLFIQGGPLLLLRPQAWLEAAMASFEAMAKGNADEIAQRLITQVTPAEAKAYVNATGKIGEGSEFFEAMGIFGKIPKEFNVPGTKYDVKNPFRLIHFITGRVAGGFNVFLLSGRIKLNTAFRENTLRQARREGWIDDAEKVEGELIKQRVYLDSLLGAVDTNTLGLSATHRQLENGALLFASRYTRAIAGLMAHAFSTGATAQQARSSLAQVMGASALIMGGLAGQIATAQGKSNKEAWDEVKATLNPLQPSKKWMSVKIGDNHYGVGGAMRAFFYFSVDLYPDENPWDKFREMIEEAKEEDIPLLDPLHKESIWRDKIWNNPIGRVLRSRTTQTTGTLIDFIDGEDFMGREFTVEAITDDPLGVLPLAVARKTLPFSMSTVLELQTAGTHVDTKTAAYFTESAGIKQVPESLSERRTEITSRLFEIAGVKEGSILDLLKLRGYLEGTKWDEDAFELDISELQWWQFDPLTQALLENDPNYEAIQERADEVNRERNFKRQNYYDNQDVLKQKRNSLLAKAAQKSASLNSLQPLKHYRLKGRSPILNKHRITVGVNREEAERKGIVKDGDADTIFDKARDEYSTLLYEEDTENKNLVIEMMGIEEEEYVPLKEGEEFNFDEYKRRKEHLITSYSQAWWDHMKLSSLSDLPEAERIFREDKDYITSSGYWEVDEILAKKHRVESQLALYKELLKTDQVKAKLFLRSSESSANKILRTKVINKTSEFRKAMRKKDFVDGEYKLDNILYKLGYVNRLITDEVPNPSRIYRP